MEIIKEWYEYSKDEERALESNKYSWIDSVNRYTDEIDELRGMLINNKKYAFWSLRQIKNREITLKIKIEQKTFALTRIADCQKHLDVIYASRRL